MVKTVPIIGIENAELRWIRMLVALLRHPDPSMPELARQALLYLTEAAGKRNPPAEGEPRRAAYPRGPAARRVDAT
ncbi:MAG TPA: hypothetical protein VE959_38565 [Bryobacteraceae bacterium]|nr:hypothetical protein [Bryobacteraceae bacterium]